ncbi:MAG: lipid-A-disaccharide synthase [Planctomycetota bacterium]|jgi:lipid-A-disaccharide synthase
MQTLGIWLTVVATLLRELVRAFSSPFRLLAYLPFRHKWRQRATEALEAAAKQAGCDDEALAQFYACRRPRRGEQPHLFVSAGEASGELHAARLVKALPDDLRVTAFGGSQLTAAGANVTFGLSEHAVMGVVGVLQQLPLILRAFAAYLRMLRNDPPDLIVLVDYPGLHLVMAKAAKRRKIPVLHYIAPQYWAWGPWRMRRYRRAVDATLTILPFETEFFRRQNVPAIYIGHPLLDEIAESPPADEVVAEVRARKTLVIMPGSRRAEIQANLEGMLRVANKLRERDPSLRIVLPHKNPRRTEMIRALLKEIGANNAEHQNAEHQNVEHHEGPLSHWLRGAHMVLAKSGTGSLEACLHGNPTIVVYKLRGMLAAIGYHNILSVPWIAGANLIANRVVAPEHCFAGDEGWQSVERDAERLWFDEAARDACKRDLQEVQDRLGAPGATARVSEIVRQFLQLKAPKMEATN